VGVRRHPDGEALGNEPAGLSGRSLWPSDEQPHASVERRLVPKVPVPLLSRAVVEVASQFGDKSVDHC
jgi:hypothetical protein